MAVPNNAPVVTLSTNTVQPAAGGAPVLLSSIVTATDPDGDPITSYLFDDTTTDAKSAIFVNGVLLPTHEDFLSPEEFASAVIVPVSTPHHISIRASDGTAPTIDAPVLTVDAAGAGSGTGGGTGTGTGTGTGAGTGA